MPLIPDDDRNGEEEGDDEHRPEAGPEQFAAGSARVDSRADKMERSSIALVYFARKPRPMSNPVKRPPTT